MNFNQVPGNNGLVFGGRSQPAGQQMDPGRNFPMLPPQFANLSPQQLQQLRSQPQFQTIMRNWLQKQQQQQQQQFQLAPQQSQQHQHHQNSALNAQQVQRMHMAGSGQGQVPPGYQQQPQNIAQMRAQQLLLQQQQQQQHRQAANTGAQGNTGNAGAEFAVGSVGGNGLFPGHPGMAGQPINAQVQAQAQVQHQGLAQVQNVHGIPTPQAQGLGHPLERTGGFPGQHPGPEGPGSVAKGPHVGHGVDGPGPAHSLTSLPQFNALSVNYKQQSTTVSPRELVNAGELSSLDMWSKKLEKEGKSPSVDLKIYEKIIEKDTKYLQRFPKQLNTNKRLLDGLVLDIKTYTDIKQLRMNAISLSHKGHFNNSIWGEGYLGYGNGITNTYTRLVLPKDVEKYLKAGVDARLTDNAASQLALDDSERELVPIRLDFDNERDRFKLRDTFLWNLNEKMLTVEGFASLLMEDYKFIPPLCHGSIVSVINEQIKDYRKKPLNSTGELRVPLKIDITINSTQLVDQFEWDILNFEDNDPEDFAATLSDEMNLPGEFATAIAHSIREQIQLFHKALTIVGYGFDGSAVHEDEIRLHILPSLRVPENSNSNSLSDDFYLILRNPALIADNTPTLVKLTQLELDRLDKEMERDARRKRRHNNTDEGTTSGRGGSSRRAAVLAQQGRGSGPVIPDLSEIPKTLRTPAPSSILPGGVDLTVPDVFTYNEVAVQRTLIRNPDYKPPANNHRVRYHHDQLRGRFLVTIKTR